MKIWRAGNICYLRTQLHSQLVNHQEKPIVLTGGHFNPLHIGHLQLFREAKKLGILVVAVNNDLTSIVKRGYSFMPIRDRMEIISELECVDYVVENEWENMTKIFPFIGPDIYVKGGDITADNINKAEKDYCEKVGCKILYGVGGEKVQSSSWLLDKYQNHIYEKIGYLPCLTQ